MLLIKNALLADWRRTSNNAYDILIDRGVIQRIDSEIDCPNANVLEAKGLIAIPGIVDSHVHLREPGYEWKETVKSGVMAAAAGGVTTLCAMPNVKPCPDSTDNYSYVKSFQKDSPVRIVQSCSINRNLSGERSDWKQLHKAGATLFSNDGMPVERNTDMAAILKFSKESGTVVAEHPEIPEIEEELGGTEKAVICRDVMLNEIIGGNLHIQHVSLASSIVFLEEARRKNISFTIETCPHYFVEPSRGLPRGSYEVYPPLRCQDDMIAVREAIKSGLIDVIASDHAPHKIEEKTGLTPARGFSGIELLFPLTYSALVREGVISLENLCRLMVFSPSKLLGIEPCSFENGKRADIALFDPDETWVVEESGMYSKGKNSPFVGKRIKGRIKFTIASGRVIFPSFWELS